MNGCVFKRKLPSGSITWGYSIDVGKNEQGKRKQIFKSGFPTMTAAGDALRKKLNEKDEGELVRPDPTTFAAFIEEWFKEHAERNCTPKTVERYRQLAKCLMPHIGTARLQDLSTLALERVFNRVKDAGGWNPRKKESRPLSAKTVRHIAGLVHVALETAKRWKLIRTNPVDDCQLPKIAKREARSLDPDQLRAFIDAIQKHGLYELVQIAAATACRRGELLALTWADVDFNGRRITVSKSLEQTKQGLRVKSTKNEEPRQIPLPKSAVEMLRQQRNHQAERRRLFHSDYRDDLNLVFAALDGNYLKPNTVSARICVLAEKAGMKGVHLHTLRHSYGSLLLSEGVPLPAVSKLLGHSSVYVTATIYSHAFSKDESAAADKWDAAMNREDQKKASQR